LLRAIREERLWRKALDQQEHQYWFAEVQAVAEAINQEDVRAKGMEMIQDVVHLRYAHSHPCQWQRTEVKREAFVFDGAFQPPKLYCADENSPYFKCELEIISMTTRSEGKPFGSKVPAGGRS
jgi:hypothetical protein